MTREFAIERAMALLSLHWPIWGLSSSSIQRFYSQNQHQPCSFRCCPPPLCLSVSHFLSVPSLPFPCLQSMMGSQLWNIVVNMALSSLTVSVDRDRHSHIKKCVAFLCVSVCVFMHVHVRVYAAVGLCHCPQKENT